MRPLFSWRLAIAFVGAGILAGGVAQAVRSDFDSRGAVSSRDGLRLVYESQGEGPTLVALAGGPGISHHGFHPYLGLLRRAARVVYFDPRGRGDSDHADTYNISADVADVEALRTGLSLDRVDLLGHSYGAHLVVAYALEHPEAVRRLVLVSPIVGASAWGRHLRTLGQAPGMNELLLQIRSARGEVRVADRGSFQSIAALLVPLYTCGGGGWRRLSAAFRPRHHLPRQNAAVYEAIVGRPFPELHGDLALSDVERRLGEIRVPVLVVQGGCDRATPAKSVVELTRALARARLVVLARSGHAPFADQTERFAEEVTRFLTEP
jgi:proline-specific peptidase